MGFFGEQTNLIKQHTKWTGSSGGSVVENLPANAADKGSIPRSGRSPGEGNGNALQYSWQYWKIPWISHVPGNPMDRGAWWATVHGVKTVGHDLATKQC